MVKFFKAIFLQFSGIVGAGIFALPFIFYSSNFYFSIFILLIVGLVMFFLNSFYISIITNTKGDHQLSGYTKIYLGNKFKILSLLSLSFLCFGGIIAYTKLASTFITQIFPTVSILGAALFFVGLVGTFHLSQLNSCKSIFQFLPIINIFIIILVLLLSLKFPSPSLGSTIPKISYFGGIIFALSGFTIIPEVEESLRSSKHKKFLLHLASTIGLILSIIIYVAFVYSVIRISGQNITSDAVIGVLQKQPILGYFLIFFGLTTVFKSCLNFVFIIKEIFFRDLKFSQNLSITISTIIPFLSLFFINISFIKMISLIGIVSSCVSALIICLIKSKISRSFFVYLISFLIILTLLSGLILEKFI